MKKYPSCLLVFFLLMGYTFSSCQKELSCEGCAKTNQPPIAFAGLDQSIALPMDSISLDGSASSDPDGTIKSFLWKKISGPTTFSITNANDIQTQVGNMVAGVYNFELNVTDTDGLSDQDTVIITVNTIPATSTCDNNRPLINAQVKPFGMLSEERSYVSMVSGGDKIFFAGGLKTNSYWEPSSRVDIYNLTTQGWTIAELSVPRYGMATLTAGNKIFFAGGAIYDDADNWIFYSTVDIYDLSTNTWSVASLSEPRGEIAVAAVGNKVFFASGWKDNFDNNHYSDKLDIYDIVTNRWSTETWNVPRAGIRGLTLNNKIYFAGGSNTDSISKRIDIYDNTTNSWSIEYLSEPRSYCAGITVANKIYWAGGYNQMGPQASSCSIEIKDITNSGSTISYLSKPSEWHLKVGQNAVLKDDKIVFLRQYPYENGMVRQPERNFDIYNIHNNTWSIGQLPSFVSEIGGSIIAVNNTIYLITPWDKNFRKQVWKLEF